MIVQLNLMILLHLLDLCQVILFESLNLDAVPFMDFRSDFIPNVLVQVLNFLENAPLEFSARASTLSQLIIAIVVEAPVTSTFGPELLDYRKFLLEYLFQIVDFGLQVCMLVIAFTLKKFFLHALDHDFFGQEKILIGQHVGFEVLNLLLVRLRELSFYQFALTVENGDFGLVTGLNHGLVEENLLLTHLNLRLLQLDPVEDWLALCR